MQNPYQCVCCNEILEFAMFELHMNKCRNSPYRCNVCFQSFADNQLLQSHQRAIHSAAAVAAAAVATNATTASASATTTITSHRTDVRSHSDARPAAQLKCTL